MLCDIMKAGGMQPYIGDGGSYVSDKEQVTVGMHIDTLFGIAPTEL